MACQCTLQVTCQSTLQVITGNLSKYIAGNYRWLVKVHFRYLVKSTLQVITDDSSVKKKSGPKFIIILFDQWYNYKEDQASFSKSSPRLYIQIMLKMHKKTRKIQI